jgi:NADH-quinone oxidoreductase subunit N
VSPALGAGLAGVPSLDWVALGPVTVVVVGALVVLLVDALRPRRLARLHDVVALVSLGLAAAAVVGLATGRGQRLTACVPGQGLELPGCSFAVSDLTIGLQAIVIVGATGCLLLAMDGPGARDRTTHHMLLLTATAGALAVAGARDLATLAVAFETSSLPAVGLVALRRDTQGAQAAVTLLLTAIGSLGLLLLGSALVYAATGTLYLDRVATVLATPQLDPSVAAVAALGALLAVAGIAFKVSLVPFHLWTPDTYAGAPLPVAAFLAVVSKTAGVAAMLVLLGIGLPSLASVWAPVVGVLALVTMTVGNLVALRQRVAVRLLAWSTVAQAGWVLVPLAAARSGTPSSLHPAIAASVGYLIAYVVATLAAFAVVVLLARHHPAGEEHTLEAYRGLARREPVAAGILGFALACLAGLPPGVMGLVAKVVAVRPLVDAGTWVFAVVAALNVALGLAYYVRWAGLLVMRPAIEPPTWRVSAAEGLALGGAGAACLVLSVAGQVIAGAVPGVLR